MSNLWFNFRFGRYFLQFGPDGFRFFRGDLPAVTPKPWFRIYTLFGDNFVYPDELG